MESIYGGKRHFVAICFRDIPSLECVDLQIYGVDEERSWWKRCSDNIAEGESVEALVEPIGDEEGFSIRAEHESVLLFRLVRLVLLICAFFDLGGSLRIWLSEALHRLYFYQPIISDGKNTSLTFEERSKVRPIGLLAVSPPYSGMMLWVARCVVVIKVACPSTAC